MNWNYVGAAFFACLSIGNICMAGSHATQAMAAVVCWGQAWILFDRGLRKSFRLPK